MFAAFAALVAGSLFIPLLGLVLIWLLPLPLMIFTVRQGLKPAVVLWLILTAVTFLITGLLGLPALLLFAAAGVVAGELIRRRQDAFTVWIGTSLSYIAGLLLVYLGSILIFEFDPVVAMQDWLAGSISTAESLAGSLGQDTEAQLEEIQEMLGMVADMAPMILVLLGITMALVTQGIGHLAFSRLNMPLQRFPAFRLWQMPRAFLWYYLVTLILVLIGVPDDSAMYPVLWNVHPLLEIAMFVQGATVIFFFAYTRRVKMVFPVLLLIISFVMPFLLYLIRILGIIDLGFNLKSRMDNDRK
ncbi:uncharacterized protein YybS (DUF2232 family) [Salsuginibacillus halophilus]|uniref:Uncharacterized protein YybS (DUF2232 family) n=2 Tax=Salsuginibacillus halophilus TaxID=517424 RepID=A0A2P8HI65_9BACI|nr:uncharacterized protein YybS (DUF2232 family) [Salsuginibacillus halophilus]